MVYATQIVDNINLVGSIKRFLQMLGHKLNKTMGGYLLDIKTEPTIFKTVYLLQYVIGNCLVLLKFCLKQSEHQHNLVDDRSAIKFLIFNIFHSGF